MISENVKNYRKYFRKYTEMQEIVSKIYISEIYRSDKEFARIC